MTGRGTYRIRPVEWTEHRPDDDPDGGYWTAGTVFGYLTICGVCADGGGGYHWTYCVCDYYDEGGGRCGSLAEAKGVAERWFLARILPALDEVQAPDTPHEPAG